MKTEYGIPGPDPRAALLVLIDCFCERVGMAPSRLGREALGDPNFVLNLRAGRVPRVATMIRVLNFIQRCNEANGNWKTLFGDVG